MGSLSIWHWLIFLVVALLFFGGSGKISGIMGDFAKGIKSFKKGLEDDADEAKAEEAKKTAERQKVIEAQGTPVGQTSTSESKAG
ncbi:MAG: twin-arginine translocase TatA/TatE family subunit [Hyphomicrobiaceae bacterium]